jgi:cation transport ATPase
VQRYLVQGISCFEGEKMEEDIDLDSKTIQEFLVGAVALFLLMMLMLFRNSMGYFFTWIVDRFLFYIISFLFINVAVDAILNQRWRRENTNDFIVGLLLFIPYAYFTDLTFIGSIQMFLELIVIVSFFTTIGRFVSRKI